MLVTDCMKFAACLISTLCCCGGATASSSTASPLSVGAREASPGSPHPLVDTPPAAANSGTTANSTAAHAQLEADDDAGLPDDAGVGRTAGDDSMSPLVGSVGARAPEQALGMVDIPMPQIRFKDPIVVGALSLQATKHILNRHRPAFQVCYGRGADNQAAGAGQAILVIEKNGEVTTPQVAGVVQGTTVGACMARVYARMQFPAATASSRVTETFDLVPAITSNQP